MKGGIEMDNTKLVERDYPVLATKGVALFPHNEINIEAGRVFSKRAIRKSNENFEGYILVIPQKYPYEDVLALKNLNTIGTIAKIKNVRNYENGLVKVAVIGLHRAEIQSIYMEDGSYFASFEVLNDIQPSSETEEAYVRVTAKAIEDLITVNQNIRKNIAEKLSKGVGAAELSDLIAQILIKDSLKQLEVLNELHIDKRLELCITALNNERQIDQIENEISEKVRQKLDSNQREYILREKLRAIKEELGDVTPTDKDCDELREQIQNKPYPDYVKAKALTEIKRLEMMSSASAEYSMEKSYVDWLLSIPWYEKTEDTSDIHKVEQILNEDHYGLDKIKERILEYLAVKTVTNSLKAPIICFSGPPGVGKTSLAKSIARALDRKFVKMSLGGLKDESEIRGHRRTYLGSLPGRIIQNMKKAGVVNPVFLLDEIDKMGSDYKGDPTSAMLELLDPEQNKYFSDNYIEEPYDLSNVLFICTANYLENIPAPLVDRLEIIDISSYTEMEKVNIATKHLVAKQLIAHGIEDEHILFNEDAIMYIIRYYTREAGVRNLERAIAKICRKLVIRKLKNKDQILDIKEINISIVKEFLGKEIYDYSKKEKEDQVGVVTGLAYTQFGGDILPIEVNYFAGKGALILTGKLGDVMKESASIAFDYVKANAAKYDINTSVFDKIDVHIHVPEGAVPKDGPSAGITLTTAIVSVLTNRSVRSDLAMTGEVTLRGNVLPIGGLKEKSISAHRSGIKTVLIPKDNEKDLDELPKTILDEVKFIPVSYVDEVLDIALNAKHVS